jgi:quercetin dioxygenase-like cupin family protein
MEELSKGLAVALSGPEADGIVARARRQIESWGLAMPDTRPLVFDFGLGDFARTGEVEFWIANEVEAGYCGKFLFVFAGQTCPSHYHRDKLETFFLVKGRLRVLYDGTERILEAGDTLRVETGRGHSFTGLQASLLLEVSRPSIIADNYFENPDIPIGGGRRG